MSSYITQEYVKTFLSEPQINTLIGYGENVSGSLKLDMLISASSDQVDSFLVPAGYDLPLASVPESIKQATAYLVLNNLYTLSQQPIPQQMQDQVSAQYSYLNLLRDKKLILPGNEQNLDTGTGASTFDYNLAGDDEVKRVMDKKSLRGSFF
jgi:hypothetical protein